MRWNDTVNVPSGTSAILYRPLLSVVVERRRSVRETCTSAIGAPDELVTRPDTVPVAPDSSVMSMVSKCMTLSCTRTRLPREKVSAPSYVGLRSPRNRGAVTQESGGGARESGRVRSAAVADRSPVDAVHL